MSDVIPRKLKKTTSLPHTIFLASTNAAYTKTQRQTDTHTSIAIGEMQCIAFRQMSLFINAIVDISKLGG